MTPNVSKQNNWYVIYTCPNMEKKICNELARRSITAFLPTQRVTRQWCDRKKNLEVPLFPNYVFVHIPAREMWIILMVNGVVKFISFEGRPAIVNDTEIEMVKKLMLVTAEISVDSGYGEGEKVQVKQGPLSGVVGKVIKQKGVARLYVQLEAINKFVAVDIDARSVERVD